MARAAEVASPVPAVAEPAGPTRRIRRFVVDGSTVIAACAVLLFVIACFAVPGFATGRNQNGLFLSVALVGIAAVGLSFITIVGRIFSLSIASTIAITTIVFASTLQLGAAAALFIAALVGAVSGVLQGAMVGLLRTDPIITTIAASAMQIGIFQVVTGGLNITGKGDSSVFATVLFGVLPVQVLAFIVVAAVAAAVHRYTIFGRLTTLVGLNERAAEVSGLTAAPVVVAAFAISGLLAGVAGGLLASQSGQGNLGLGGTFGFDAITAVVVGGISVKGGRGSPLGAAIGAVFVGLIGNVLVLAGLNYQVQLVVKGLLVLVAVIASGVLANRSSGRR